MGSGVAGSGCTDLALGGGCEVGTLPILYTALRHGEEPELGERNWDKRGYDSGIWVPKEAYGTPLCRSLLLLSYFTVSPHPTLHTRNPCSPRARTSSFNSVRGCSGELKFSPLHFTMLGSKSYLLELSIPNCTMGRTEASCPRSTQ